MRERASLPVRGKCDTRTGNMRQTHACGMAADEQEQRSLDYDFRFDDALMNDTERAEVRYEPCEVQAKLMRKPELVRQKSSSGKSFSRKREPGIVFVHPGTVYNVFSVCVRAFVPLSAPCGVRVRHPLVFSGTQNCTLSCSVCVFRRVACV